MSLEEFKNIEDLYKAKTFGTTQFVSKGVKHPLVKKTSRTKSMIERMQVLKKPHTIKF